MKPKQAQQWKEIARAMCHNLLDDLTDSRKALLWKELEPFVDEYANEPVDGWQNDYCLLDSFFDWFYYPYGATILTEYKNGDCDLDDNPRRFFNQLRCIARASINVIFPNDPTGVIGFTVGDMRRVFGDKLPTWYTAQYNGLTHAAPDNAPIRL